MRGPAKLAALALAPVLLAACQPAAAPSGAGASVTLGDYQLISMGGQDVGSSHVTMLLEDGRISGGGFCNRYTAGQSATLPALSIGPVAMTRRACPGDRMARDDAYLKALEATTQASFAAGRLTLLGSGPELVYEPHQPD